MPALLSRAARALRREWGFLTGRYAIPHGLFHQVRRHTLVGVDRLDNAYRLTLDIERRGLAGAVVECGVWRGGCAAVMAQAVKEHGYRRHVHLLDSFEGLPEPTADDGALAASAAAGRVEGKLAAIGRCVGTRADVEDLFFGRLGIDRSRVSFHVGWFQDTLPKARREIGPIALLRLDGDWYESTRVCLEQLYPQIVPGGYLILDDYGKWEGCRKAFHEYAEKNGFAEARLEPIDGVGVFLAKK